MWSQALGHIFRLFWRGSKSENNENSELLDSSKTACSENSENSENTLSVFEVCGLNHFVCPIFNSRSFSILGMDGYL
jgi:hypothetical protein